MRDDEDEFDELQRTRDDGTGVRRLNGALLVPLGRWCTGTALRRR